MSLFPTSATAALRIAFEWAYSNAVGIADTPGIPKGIAGTPALVYQATQISLYRPPARHLDLLAEAPAAHSTLR